METLKGMPLYIPIVLTMWTSMFIYACLVCKQKMDEWSFGQFVAFWMLFTPAWTLVTLSSFGVVAILYTVTGIKP